MAKNATHYITFTKQTC